MTDLHIFLEDKHFIDLKDVQQYEPMQIGSHIKKCRAAGDELESAEIIIVGCGDWSGVNKHTNWSDGPNKIREEFYKMYYWHNDIPIADIGNIQQGATPNDTRHALLAVLQELDAAGKTTIVLGAGHDLMMQQYEVYKKAEKMAVVSVADMLIDLDETEETNASGFLLEMLTSTPNFVSHFSHIGFQSYYVHPQMLETLDKLRFDFYRLGKVRENIDDIEPVLRISNIFGLDLSVVRFSDCPSNINGSPNGITGEEACLLTRYAGMSKELTSLGIYNYTDHNDPHNQSAKLVAQMLWYFLDGYRIRKTEAILIDEIEFVKFNVVFSDIDAEFLKSKRTGRWWMKLPNEKYIPCSYNDYILASSGEIPERWLREQERLS